MKNKRIIFLVIIFTCLINKGISQNSDSNRKELYDLLNERKEKFNSYSTSLEKKSGIFGNKTKNDIKKSNEVLIDIVKTDNRIISALNRVADFKDFQKVNLTYEANATINQISNLLHATDTLTKQVDFLTAANGRLELKNRQQTFLLYVTFIIIIAILTGLGVYKIFFRNN